MAIKLNWQDLQKRIRNGVEAQKVMLNWVQIRPEWTPPTPIFDAWIYHNAIRWLISISSDWQTWWTISDKNAWANTVYNYWDTVTHNNGWDYFQYGNCYWFYPPLANTSDVLVDVSECWQNRKYASSTFIADSDTWMTSMNNRLWTWANSWMSWMPTWSHIPTYEEWNTLVNYMTALWLTTLNDYEQYLWLPAGWFLNGSDWIFWQGVAFYRTSTPSTWSVWTFRLAEGVARMELWYNTFWWYIRPFRDEPRSWWSILYDWWNWAWIFEDLYWAVRNISPDWEHWITIFRRNLWASETYPSSFEPWYNQYTCWNLYQWGNCHWFAYWQNASPISSTRVDVSGYGVCYDSNVFITPLTDTYWTTGWRSDLEYLWTNKVPWPCPVWFHTPVVSEWKSVFSILRNWWWISDSWVSEYLKLPCMWVLFGWIEAPTKWYYWCSDSNYILFNGEWYWNEPAANRGKPIRPFKDKPVVPDDTRTVLYQPN